MKDIYGVDITKEKLSVSRNFKLWTLFFISFITIFHLYQEFHFKADTIIPPMNLLGVALVLIVYLWLQEMRDRYHFQGVSTKLSLTQSELMEANLDTIMALVAAEEETDPYTKNHCRRVTDFALQIAERLGLTKEQREVVRRAGMVHDIGKIGFLRGIINKPGKLTFEEWLAIKKHPEKGAMILAPLKFLPSERDIIQHHHEHYDGTGYPDGMKGDDIPLGARILSVADAFDAMKSARPYREKPLEREQIISELKNNAGVQFDPKVVEAFLDILEKDTEIWKQQ